MSADPWTDPDPKPGDFDADLAKLDPRYVEDREGVPDAKLIVLVGVGPAGTAAPTIPCDRCRPPSMTNSARSAEGVPTTGPTTKVAEGLSRSR